MDMNEFDKAVGGSLKAGDISIVQVNVGLVCNQACVHCHLECSPDRMESMSWETMQRVLDVIGEAKPALVDITGGAPELNPNLRQFVDGVIAAGHRVQVRTNLSAMLEPGNEDYPEFFASRAIDLVASLPCYLEENVCRMRGGHSFTKSIRVLKVLNGLGYGQEGGPKIDLVFNHPLGPYLPPSQCALEQDYKRELRERHGIVFNRLLTITNVPIGRYFKALEAVGQGRDYMKLLKESFNGATVDGLMCRHQVNVAWDGTVYDCDFNQALGLPVDHGAPDNVECFDLAQLINRRVVTGDHCFACTAGAGSSCGGALSE